MPGDPLFEAFVRLRALNDGSFEKDARDSLMPAAQRVVGDLARIGAGLKLFQIGKEGIAELGQQQKAIAQTGAVIRSTGGEANVAVDHVLKLADSLGGLSGKDAEAIQQGENLLLTFRNIRNEAGAGNDIFDRTTKAALDLSIAFGQDMSSSAIQLGKALDDPVRGLTALQRIGVRFSTDQVELIKQLEATGQHLEAQKVILKEVETQVGGSAKAYGETLPGQLERAKNASDDMKAALVGGLAPALELGAGLSVKLAGGVQSLPEPLQAAAGAVVLLGGGILSLSRPVADIVGLYARWRTASQAAAAATAVETASTEANVVAKEMAVGSTAHLAAVEAAFAAETKAATIASSSAFGVWGVAAATAIVGVSTALDILGAKQNHDFKDLQADLAKTGTGLAETFQFLQNEGNKEDPAKWLKALSEQGTLGLGALVRMRDAMKALGQDTTEVDKIIAEATAAQHQYSLSTEEGTVAISGQSAAADKLEASRQKAVDSVRSLFDAERGATSAHRATEDALDGVKNAQERVIDAQRRLTEALKPASAEDVRKGQLDISDANLQAQQSADAVAQAERDLEMARQRGSSFDVAEAERRLQQARNDHERSVFAVTDAEERLQEVERKGTEQDQAVIDARRAVSDAEQAVVDAKDRVVDAQLAEMDAALRLTQAQQQLYGGTQTANEKMADQIVQLQALAAMVDPASPQGKILNDYLDKLLGLQSGTFGVTREDLVAALTNGGQFAPTRAGGGPVGAGQVFAGAEVAPELLVLNRPGLYRSPGDGTVFSGTDTQRFLAGDRSGSRSVTYEMHFHVEKADELPGSVRRETDRIELLAST